MFLEWVKEAIDYRYRKNYKKEYTNRNYNDWENMDNAYN